jgi:endogenous inhibitor of DNA gyrase (YacG/DUF329 family)
MRKKVICPKCRKETKWRGNPYRPFCSKRCKLIDLGSWIDERYLIPEEKGEQSPNNEDVKEQN